MAAARGVRGRYGDCERMPLTLPTVVCPFPEHTVNPKSCLVMAATASSLSVAVLQRKTPDEVHAMDFEPVDEKTRELCDSIVKAVKTGGKPALMEYAVRFGDVKEGEMPLPHPAAHAMHCSANTDVAQARHCCSCPSPAAQGGIVCATIVEHVISCVHSTACA